MAAHKKASSSGSSSPTTPVAADRHLFGSLNPNHHVNGGSTASLRNNVLPVDAWVLEGSTPPPPTPVQNFILARRAAAEFIATFILVFCGSWVAIQVLHLTGSAATQLLALSVSSGLTVMILILSTGHISGACLNPSITLAFAVLKHLPWRYVPAYVGAQLTASICAAFAVKCIFHPVTMAAAVTVPSGDIKQAFVMEFIASFILMFVIAAVSDAKAVKELSAVAVGATIALNVFIAGNVSGASMNPARTLGPAVATNTYRAIWVYFTAPTFGALAGACVYSAVKITEAHPERLANR